MDLKNLEGTSTYAIEAVYREYWNLIPDRYKLKERAQRNRPTNFDEEEYLSLPDNAKPHVKRVTPLQYSDVDKREKPLEGETVNKADIEYEEYLEHLNDRNTFFDVTPFYDPELSFENRFHMHLTNVDFPHRREPWFVITWNSNNGILNSSLTRRRFTTSQIISPSGKAYVFDFINVDMDLTMAIYSNTMQGLFELQENIVVGQREKCVVNTSPHSIIGSFPVSLDIIGSSLNKLPKDKGTLCVMTLNVKMDFPVIGNVRDAATGIIKEIHTEIDKIGTGPENVYVYSRDIIDENT